MIVKLHELIVDCKLGSLKFDMSPQGAVHLLGQPDDTHRTRDGWLLFKYGGLELAFLRRSLHGICIYFDDGRQLPPCLNVEGYFPTCDTTLAEFIEHLREVGISCKVDSLLTFDTQVGLVVGKGVTVVFGLEANDSRIDSIQCVKDAEEHYRRRAHDLRDCQDVIRNHG